MGDTPRTYATINVLEALIARLYVDVYGTTAKRELHAAERIFLESMATDPAFIKEHRAAFRRIEHRLPPPIVMP